MKRKWFVLIMGAFVMLSIIRLFIYSSGKVIGLGLPFIETEFNCTAEEFLDTKNRYEPYKVARILQRSGRIKNNDEMLFTLTRRQVKMIRESEWIVDFDSYLQKYPFMEVDVKNHCVKIYVQPETSSKLLPWDEENQWTEDDARWEEYDETFAIISLKLRLHRMLSDEQPIIQVLYVDYTTKEIVSSYLEEIDFSEQTEQ